MAARITQDVVELGTFQNGTAKITQDVLELVIGLGIDCASPPAGAVGIPYTHAFPAGSGDPPYTFAITAGALPTGVTLAAATGIASGTPSVGGTFFFTVTVTDSVFATSSVACSITITGTFSIALYGYKRFKFRPVCAPDLVELPEVPSPPRVL